MLDAPVHSRLFIEKPLPFDPLLVLPLRPHYLIPPTAFSSPTKLLEMARQLYPPSKMATSAEHEKRLIHLHALYEQGFKKGGTFSECIEQCEHSLREYAGMAPFWRIKTYCLLVGACQHDWHEAEVSTSGLSTCPPNERIEKSQV